MKKFYSNLFLTILASFTYGFSQEDICIVEGSTSSAQYINTTINLKILLVEFSDVKCKKIYGNNPKYTEANFVEMLGSDGVYVSPSKYSPDGDAIYGSMNDYFRKMSTGNVVINVTLLNEIDDEYIKPIWITLPDSKLNYHKGSNNRDIFADAVTYASMVGITIGVLDNYNKLVIIYAGNRWNRYPVIAGDDTIKVVGHLNPQANSTTYIMSEREDSPMDQENSTDKFARIGTHCHEFAHTLGIQHASGSRADVMESGVRNGNRAAPAPLNPIARTAKGWLTPTLIIGQQQYDLHYSLIAPQVFRINGNVSGEFFLIENRQFDQNMTIGAFSIPDYNNSTFMPIAHSQNSSNTIYSQGVLVWRATYNYPSDRYEDDGLIYASGRYNRSFPDNIPSETDAGDIFPGAAGIKVLSPWSDYRDPYSSSYDPVFSTFPNVFVPNTKSSTNVGMEILSENSGSGYFTVKMYQSDPQDASPSKPQNTAISVYTGGGEWNPQVSWSAMLEPDVTTGGAIYVERAYKLSGGSWSTWATVATLSGTASSFIDQTYTQAGSGNDSLKYRVRAKDSQNKYSIYSDEVKIRFNQSAQKRGFVDTTPKEYDLYQNYPNPFNPSTTIHYSLPQPGVVRLTVYDLVGREVTTLVNEQKDAGHYTVDFNGEGLASGMYLYRLSAGPYTQIKRMMLAK